MNASVQRVCNGPALPLIIREPVFCIPIASRRAGHLFAPSFTSIHLRLLMQIILLYSTPEGAYITFIPGP